MLSVDGNGNALGVIGALFKTLDSIIGLAQNQKFSYNDSGKDETLFEKIEAAVDQLSKSIESILVGLNSSSIKKLETALNGMNDFFFAVNPSELIKNFLTDRVSGD